MIRYRGRIDDQYNPGINRPKPKRNDLAEALNEFLAGKAISQPTTTAVGCFVGRVHKPAANGTRDLRQGHRPHPEQAIASNVIVPARSGRFR